MKKSRNTKTKMKALSAEAIANAEQAKAAADKLEEDIIKAAQGQSHGQGQTEETKTLIEVNRVPESAVTAQPPVRYNPDARGTGAGPTGPGSEPAGGRLPGTSFGGNAQRSGPPVHNSALNGRSAHLHAPAPGQGQPPQPPAPLPNLPSDVSSGASANLMRLPENTDENMDDKISGLWKSRVLGAYRANPKASQHILPAMPNNRGALEVTEKAKAAAQQDAMISLVDKMFDRFQNLAFEFNTVARGSDLELTWVRPVISKENISSWHQSAQIVSVFTGRISTRHWTMVVRGTQDSVVVYVIPAEKMLTFANQPANFQPVIELFPVADGLTVRWWVLDKVVSNDDLVNIYRALLDNMIRIAQNDASCDQFIDLASYGVFLQGGEGPAPGQVAQLSSAQMAHPAGFASPQPQPNAAGAQAPADDDGWKSADADWKPVVRSLKGNNQSAGGSDLPSTPGFNDDEPGRYSMPGSMSGSGSGAFGGAQYGNSQTNNSQFGNPQFNSGGFIADRDDEAPSPSLPAHLFEGLPPRPQPQAQPPAQSSAQPSVNEFKPLTPAQPGPPGMPVSNPNPSNSAANSVASPWGAPTGTGSGVSYSSVGSRAMPPLPNAQPQSPPPTARDSSDGWKKADAKGGGAVLPPLPVPNFNQSTGNSFISEPAPLANALVSPESFTSGSIRVDALAKEIAHTPMALPQAVPGFEPYKVDETPAAQPTAEDNAFISSDFVGMDSSDRDVAALFDGEDVNSATRSQHGMRPPTSDLSSPALSSPSLSSPAAAVPEKPYDLNIIGNVGFGRSHTDELPWPPGAKDRSQLEAEEARVAALREKGAFDALDEAKQAPDVVPPASFAANSPAPGQRPVLDSRSAIAEGFRQAQNASVNSSSNASATNASGAAPAADPWLQAPPRAPDLPSEDNSAPDTVANPFEAPNPFETPVFDDLVEPEGSGEHGTEHRAEHRTEHRPEQKLAHQPEQMPDFFTAPTSAQADNQDDAAANEIHGYTEEFKQEHFQSNQIQAQPQSQAPSQPQPITPQRNDIASQFGDFAKKSSPLDFIDFGTSSAPEPAQAQPEPGQQKSEASPEAAIEVGFEAPPEASPEIVSEPEIQVEQSQELEPQSVLQPAPEVEMLSEQVVEQNVDLALEPSLDSAVKTTSVSAATSQNSSLMSGLRRSLNGDIDRLLATLDQELEVISDKGSEAFARRDLKGAEHLIKLAETLSEYKDGLLKLKADHGSELS